MIDHMQINKVHVISDLHFWRVVQWATAPVALGVSAAVAMTAQPFISEYMHMPTVGAWSVAVSIPLVSGLALHVATGDKSVKSLLASFGAVACMALSAVTIIHAKEYNTNSELGTKYAAEVAQVTAANTNARAMQKDIMDQQAAARSILEDKLRACPKKTITACTKAATDAYNEEASRLQSTYNAVSARIMAPPAAPPESKLTWFDYVLGLVPDLFAGILSFSFFHAKRRVDAAKLKLSVMPQPTVQKAPGAVKQPLNQLKRALGADIKNGHLPPEVIATDGQVVVNRVAKHYRLHSTTARKLLVASNKFTEVHGKLYLKPHRNNLIIIGGRNG